LTLTIKFDLDCIKVNQHAKYLGQTLFHSKVPVQTHSWPTALMDHLIG